MRGYLFMMSSVWISGVDRYAFCGRTDPESLLLADVFQNYLETTFVLSTERFLDSTSINKIKDVFPDITILVNNSIFVFIIWGWFLGLTEEPYPT
jgi:hypothetical protein